MSLDSTYYARSLGQGAAIRELSRIALTSPQEIENGQVLPARSEGTIVGTWARGAAYEVEFTRPYAALITLQPNQFEVIAEPNF